MLRTALPGFVLEFSADEISTMQNSTFLSSDFFNQGNIIPLPFTTTFMAIQSNQTANLTSLLTLNFEGMRNQSSDSIRQQIMYSYLEFAACVGSIEAFKVLMNFSRSKENKKYFGSDNLMEKTIHGLLIENRSQETPSTLRYIYQTRKAKEFFFILSGYENNRNIWDVQMNENWVTSELLIALATYMAMKGTWRDVQAVFERMCQLPDFKKASKPDSISARFGVEVLNAALMFKNKAVLTDQMMAFFPKLQHPQKRFNSDGVLPLHYAAQHANAPYIKNLALSYPEAINTCAQRNRNTPLHEAAIAENTNALLLLIELGGDINILNMHGASPLHYFFSSRNLSVTPKMFHVIDKCRPETVAKPVTVKFGNDTYVYPNLISYLVVTISQLRAKLKESEIDQSQIDLIHFLSDILNLLLDKAPTLVPSDTLGFIEFLEPIMEHPYLTSISIEVMHILKKHVERQAGKKAETKLIEGNTVAALSLEPNEEDNDPTLIQYPSATPAAVRPSSPPASPTAQTIAFTSTPAPVPIIM